MEMSNLIDRQEAIDLLFQRMEELKNIDKSFGGVMDMAIKIIKTLPSKGDERWTSFKESAPSMFKNKRMLITDKWGNVNIAELYRGEYYCNDAKICESFLDAWMDLPEPYAEDGE